MPPAMISFAFLSSLRFCFVFRRRRLHQQKTQVKRRINSKYCTTPQILPFWHEPYHTVLSPPFLAGFPSREHLFILFVPMIHTKPAKYCACFLLRRRRGFMSLIIKVEYIVYQINS